MNNSYRELLIEIGCEEMPASWLPGLTSQLRTRFAAGLDEARLHYRESIRAFTAPRRLVLFVKNLADRQSEVDETITGPPVSAGFDKDGNPTKAAIGFARKLNVDVENLRRVETEKGEYIVHRRRQRGEMTKAVLGGVLTSTLRALSFPKAMRWDAILDDGRGEFVFGRPIRWIVFLYGGKIVPFEIGRTIAAGVRSVSSIKAGRVTYGHRFFSRNGKAGQPIRVDTFSEYQRSLKSAYVLIDREERKKRIERKLDDCATKVGGRVADLGNRSTLAVEIPDLVEYPAVVTGRFPGEFLSLPDEVLTTTMIHHQHYFPIVNHANRLMEFFLAVTNTPRDNVARIARNAERVLVARLRDARFFWDADRKVPLDDRLDRLETLTFHKRLGSYRRKVERVSVMAEWIARDVFEQAGAAADARRAGELSKADLATEMVGEFPELQGVMGGVYAREQGEPETVWKAIYFHYLPIGVGVDAPPLRNQLGSAAVTWASVSLADKLDTIIGLFGAGEKPTGSRDPLGIRRQAQGMLRVLVDLPELTGVDTRITIGKVRRFAHEMHDDISEETSAREASFLIDRLRYIFEERGYDARNIKAVTHQPVDEIRPLDVRRKLEALPEFAGTPEFLALAMVFKRVKNITRELRGDVGAGSGLNGESLNSLLSEPAERALLGELKARQSVIEAAVRTGTGFREAFAEASRIGPAVDRFFADVLVMADDARLRHARLHLMQQVEEVILQLADVSELVDQN